MHPSVGTTPIASLMGVPSRRRLKDNLHDGTYKTPGYAAGALRTRVSGYEWGP